MYSKITALICIFFMLPSVYGLAQLSDSLRIVNTYENHLSGLLERIDWQDDQSHLNAIDIYLRLFSDHQKSTVYDFFRNDDNLLNRKVREKRPVDVFALDILMEERYKEYQIEISHPRVDQNYNEYGIYLIRYIQKVIRNKSQGNLEQSYEMYVDANGKIISILLCKKDLDLDTYIDSLELAECQKQTGYDYYGCPDRDNDGVPDYRDLCKDDKEYTTTGCPDSDGDGFPDSIQDFQLANKYNIRLDNCPSQGGLVNREGCPDQDLDGIPDAVDKCPNREGHSECNGCPKTKKGLCPTIGQIIFGKYKSTGSINNTDLEQLKADLIHNIETDEYWEMVKLVFEESRSKTAFREENHGMILVPAGSFLYQCIGQDTTCGPLPIEFAFFIDSSEVTNGQYVQFLNESGQHTNWVGGDFKSGKKLFENNSAFRYKRGIWKVDEKLKNHPVAYVTWYGANAFAQFYGLDLPYDREWEYAARGGAFQESYSYPGGEDVTKIAIFGRGTKISDISYTTKVASLAPNSIGLYDMAGNVFEWCKDMPDKQVNIPSVAGIRGGGFNSTADECTSISRDYQEKSEASNYIGFRCVWRPVKKT